MGAKAGYEYLTKDDEVDNTIIPQQDLYNVFIKDAPNPQYLTGDPYIDNIMRIESGGMDRTNSTTGATGPMQVKIATLADPGYGIEPAKNDSVEEKIRVGADYFNAMKEEFNGDILNATIAYNLGPGATKKWLQAGGTIDELVKIQSSDGRPVGQAALEYIQKAYGPDIINRLS
jgi:soluble lytic murein transglycosylase-like protein